MKSRKKELLKKIKDSLNEEETRRYSPYACLSRNAIRRQPDENVETGHRQNFSLDTDRILHSLAYSRYVDKTQVFYLVKNDHITHRVLHVQLVSKIARTIGRLLRLNEDLIEAISLGHDIGHTPFGHDGERILSQISHEYGMGNFLHNIQGVRFLEKIERKGKGWNLSLQVLDGILCHDGEAHTQELHPDWDKDFKTFDNQIMEKQKTPSIELRPMTLEGCVVRIADTISYIGRDIEDAIRVGLITREQIPADCTRELGNTNGKIIYTLVEDLVSNSIDKPYVGFSPEISDSLKKLKEFNYQFIYTNKRIKRDTPKIEFLFRFLFDKFYKDLKNGIVSSEIFTGFLDGMNQEYIENTPKPIIVRDFISGMTDEYFLRLSRKYVMPEIKEIKL